MYSIDIRASGRAKNVKENAVNRTRTYAMWTATFVTLFALGTGLAFISGCTGGGEGGQVKELVAGGSTFVDPMMRQWASSYDKAKGIKIDYKGGGSGKGISQMIDGNYAFGCTDAPMNEEELKSAAAKSGDVIHIPLVI